MSFKHLGPEDLPGGWKCEECENPKEKAPESPTLRKSEPEKAEEPSEKKPDESPMPSEKEEDQNPALEKRSRERKKRKKSK